METFRYNFSKEHHPACAFQFKLLIKKFKLLNASIAISASRCGYHVEDGRWCDCKRIV